MYLSLLGNSSLWSVTKTRVAKAKADALKQEDVLRRTSLYKYVSFLSRLYIFIVADVQTYAGVGLSKSGSTLNVIAATEKKLGGIKVGKNLYMTDESLNATGGEVDVLDSRLRRLEINQANLYILLESLHKFGVQANLIMVEDFQSLKVTHLKVADATVEAVGKECLTDDISFLRPSSSFVITNGLFLNQLTTAQSISSDGDTYLINTADKIADDTSRGKIYRSSVTIRDDKAYGAGLVNTRSQNGVRTWKGEGTAESAQISFDAFPSLESSFTLDGDWSLSADGYFTLD